MLQLKLNAPEGAKKGLHYPVILKTKELAELKKVMQDTSAKIVNTGNNIVLNCLAFIIAEKMLSVEQLKQVEVKAVELYNSIIQ